MTKFEIAWNLFAVIGYGVTGAFAFLLVAKLVYLIFTA